MLTGTRQTRFKQRGAVAPLTAVSMTTLIGFTAIAVDLGMLYNVRNELQRTADATALGAARELVNDDRLKVNASSAWMNDVRDEAVSYAAINKVYGNTPSISTNSGNSIDGDLVIGYLNDSTDLTELLKVDDESRFNSVQVRIRRDGTLNGPVQLFFGQLLGLTSSDLGATATATLQDGVTGFRVTENSVNAGLLPFALHIDDWNDLLNLVSTTGDSYGMNDDGNVVGSGDSIFELNLYPGAGASQLPPGNFGTVDIGSPNNSTADLSRQILEGVNESDMSYFDNNELKLGPDGTLLLNGDTGLSAGIKDELEAIKGMPRTIPLFNNVSGNGNNSMYTIVGFAGIRILNVKLTGKMSNKAVIIQPAYVVDQTAITGDASEGTSFFVYDEVRLTR